MDLDKRRLLVESYLSLGGPPPGEGILTNTDREELRRARELNLDPAPEQVNENGGPLFDYGPLMSLITTLRGINSGFNLGPIYCDPLDGGRLCQMRPAEAFRELLINERRSALGPVATVDVGAFFDGNDDPSSIGAGLLAKDGAFAVIRATLLGVGRLPAVTAVGIEIEELPSLDHAGDDAQWLIAGRVFVWITPPVKGVREALRPLAADSIERISLRVAAPPAGTTVPTRTQLYAIAWD